MKLYYTKGACSLAVRIIINELSMPCEYESVDLKTRKTETGKDFLSINPKGAVPTLVTDDNEVLTENSVIQQYLADKMRANQLLPPIPEFKRYRVLEWLNYISTDLHKGFGPLFNHVLPQEIKEKYFIPNLHSKFTYVDKEIQSHKYLMGDEFTLPDAYLFVMLNWAQMFKFDMSKWPNLSRYFDGLKTRNSIKESLQQEGLAIAA